jgi:hypothetical protein
MFIVAAVSRQLNHWWQWSTASGGIVLHVGAMDLSDERIEEGFENFIAMLVACHRTNAKTAWMINARLNASCKGNHKRCVVVSQTGIDLTITPQHFCCQTPMLP